MARWELRELLSPTRSVEDCRVLVVSLHGYWSDADGMALSSFLDRNTDPSIQVLYCDVGGLTRPDAGTVGALARLKLAADRNGCTFRLSPREDVEELVELLGLSTQLVTDRTMSPPPSST